jgi:circadian clock protein KaiB
MAGRFELTAVHLKLQGKNSASGVFRGESLMSKIATSKKPARKPPSSKPRALTKDSPRPKENWMMRLYVAGQSTRSIAAIANLRRICDRYMPGQCTVEIVDLMRNPELAKLDQIVAIPTLVRKIPAPVRRIIGDLSATEKILLSLELS